MSPDTAAKRPDSPVAERPNGMETSPEPDPETANDTAGRPGRTWTYVTAAAAAAFLGAIILVATGLIVDVAEVSDTPEHSVEAFLGALLDNRDPAEARTWMCEEKSDRDMTETTEFLADANDEVGLEWANVTETSRSVGQATVTVDLTTGDGDAATWTFTVVAENSDPQWLVCGIE